MLHAMEMSEKSAFAHEASKVLIIDDEPDIVEEVIEQLEDEGMQCVSAYSALQALEQIKSDTAISVIITDIRMPGMDGLEMARKISNDYGNKRDLFIIVVTGHAGIKEAIEALQLGAEDFLTKPISPDHLLHSVRRAQEIIHLRSNERSYQEQLESEVKIKTAEVQKLADDLAEQNKELTIVNRLKDEFMQMMSHELNTPLNAIIGFSQLLIESCNKRGDLKEANSAEHIYAAGVRLTKTVDSILTLSSMSAGDLTLEYSRFSGIVFIDSIASDYTALLEQWDAELECHIAQRPLELNIDHALMHKGIGNLVENAAKYGRPGGHVSLSIVPENDYISFIVRDNGPGMSPQQIAMACEPMRQVDGSMGRKYEGMGIGLPLAMGIAQMHGGKLTIDSKLGEGTTVTLSVPVARNAQQ